ncbi:SUN domain-containing protein 2 isoform X3 [Haplochromis burtoni]|uniref:SUN domain-containing protein 2 isoform X3 n=1 Tax=Haplochromis burtoni TaxID=8153 RepID=UPI001C2CC981|nr:SUN domain-containing protein 2 isoform X3 [Haplochromis burtoni]
MSDEDLQSWGWTDLSTYSSSDSEKEQQVTSFLRARVMSRRSLRLDEGLLDRSLPRGSASFSAGGGDWRNSRSLRSRRSQQHSVSCSESLLDAPHKPIVMALHNSSLHSVASDASLLSSLQNESSIQEQTQVDAFWESTIIAEQSSVALNSTLIGLDTLCSKHPGQASRVFCKDCSALKSEPPLGEKEAGYTTDTSSTLMVPRASESEEPEPSTIYYRDRSRRRRTDVLQLWLDSCWLRIRRAAACCVSALTHTWQVCRGLKVNIQPDNGHRVRPGRGGAMSLTESSQRELQPSGSLCNDCKDGRPSPMDAVTSSSSSWSSLVSCLLGFTWSAALFTASVLFDLAQRAARALGPLSRKAGSASWTAARSAGRTAGDAFRWLDTRWRHMTTNTPLSWFPVLLVVLSLLFLLFGLRWFGPAVLQLLLPAVNITEWRPAVSNVPALTSNSFLSSESQSGEGDVDESKEAGLLHSKPPPAETAAGEEEVGAAAEDAERLIRLEQSLMVLWERVEAGGRRAEQRHRELLRLYTGLQQLSSAQRDGVEASLSALLDQQLSELRKQLDEERWQREEVRRQDLLQQQTQTSRLDQLELQLQKLVAKTKEVQWRREAAGSLLSPSPTTLPAAVSVDRQSHDALLAEVVRLEAALGDVRRDVELLSRCQDSCQQLATIQQVILGQVSAQVREEVRALLFSNQLTAGGDAAALPESLLRWLSERYVSEADLQAALASLELSILQNVSLQLEQRRGEETVREPVLHAAEGVGATVTQEDVRAAVKDALRLFSEDRTGLADYALESGGGSILSTRCSETYETKAALLSLFGVPLWYFSQSPRAVIQPDVHPGNCWAFRGSTGFLVIRLSMRVLPSAFTLEHIPKALAPSGTLHSAPRDFAVYGLANESRERGKLLGTYTYDQDGDALQTFAVSEENGEAFQIIEVQVLSNWGHEEYTCMYRFRVHGTPSDV